MSDSNTNTPDPGAYPDEETADGRSTHKPDEIPGEYDDSEAPDGSRPTKTDDAPGEYTDADQ